MFYKWYLLITFVFYCIALTNYENIKFTKLFAKMPYGSNITFAFVFYINHSYKIWMF